MRVALFIVLIGPALAPKPGAEPSLRRILDACEFLRQGDIPEDRFLPPNEAVYVSPEAGDDEAAGDRIDAPFATLQRAFRYANERPETPLTIYLRGGVHEFKTFETRYDDVIRRGNLYITAFPDEDVTIRPYYWPDEPFDYADERAFVLRGGFENVAFDRLRFEGWKTLFSLGADPMGPPLRNVVLKRLSAENFSGRLESGACFVEIAESPAGGWDPSADHDQVRFQVEDLLLSHISLQGVDQALRADDPDDGAVRGLRLSHISLEPSGRSYRQRGAPVVELRRCRHVLLDRCLIRTDFAPVLGSLNARPAIVNSYLRTSGTTGAMTLRNGGEFINSVLHLPSSFGGAALTVERGDFRMIHSVLWEEGADAALAFGSVDSPEADELLVVNSIFRGGLAFDIRSEKVSFQNNRFVGRRGEDLRFPGSFSVDNLAELNGLPGCEGNAFSTPHWANVTAGNFSVVENDEWTDKGGVVGPGFDFDILGNLRAWGAGPDVGPVELDSIPPSPTVTGTATSTATITPSPTKTNTPAPSATDTSVPTETPVPTNASPPIETPIPTESSVSTVGPTPISSPTPIADPAGTPEPMPILTPHRIGELRFFTYRSATDDSGSASVLLSGLEFETPSYVAVYEMTEGRLQPVAEWTLTGEVLRVRRLPPRRAFSVLVGLPNPKPTAAP